MSTLFLDSIAGFLAALAGLQAEAPPPQDICVNKKTLTGCCSGRIGVLGITRDGVMCLNAELSPTCKQEIQSMLNGCCSHHGGVQYVDRDSGAVVCNKGTASPTCSAKIQACAN